MLSSNEVLRCSEKDAPMLQIKTLTHLNQPPPLRKMGFTQAQIRLFQLYRTIYRSGYFQYDPAEYERLQFARWLFLQGKISR